MAASVLRLFLCFVACVFIVVVDQVTKQYVQINLTYGEAVGIMPGVRLVLIHNPGAAFGILSNQSGWQIWFLLGVSGVAIIGLIFWIWSIRKGSLMSLMPFALILAGAIGNSLDRIRFGFVVDFINLYYDKWAWPTFNVADSCICAGVFALIISSLRDPPNRRTGLFQ